MSHNPSVLGAQVRVQPAGNPGCSWCRFPTLEDWNSHNFSQQKMLTQLWCGGKFIFHYELKRLFSIFAVKVMVMLSLLESGQRHQELLLALGGSTKLSPFRVSQTHTCSTVGLGSPMPHRDSWILAAGWASPHCCSIRRSDSTSGQYLCFTHKRASTLISFNTKPGSEGNIPSHWTPHVQRCC